VIIELPNGTELDAPDGLSPEQIKAIVQKHTSGAPVPVALPPVGMGDVQAAPSSYPDTSNVPAAMLTGDPATDRQIAENAAAQGQRHAITKRDALGAGAVALGGLVGSAAGVPAGFASGALMSGGLRAQNPNAGALEIGASGALGGLLSASAGYAAQKALGKVGAWAQGRLDRASQKATDIASEAAKAELKSESSRLGGLSQDLNRKIEWVIRLTKEESSGVISAENKAALDTFRQTPEFAGIVNKAAERVMATAPGAVESVASQEAKVAALSEGLQAKIAADTAARLSPQEAKRQLWMRLQRYGPPAIGSAIGGYIGGPVGIAVGSLAGAGTRPAVHALRRMVQDPAVQTSLLTPFAELGKRAATNARLSSAMVAEETTIPLRLSQVAADRTPDKTAQTPSTSAEGILSKARANPNLAPYADILQRAQQSGGSAAVSQMHFLLYDRDPQYRAAMQAKE